MEFTDLPEQIFIFILSLLPFTDAIRLCSCTKQWLNLWTHCKVIELDRSKFLNQARAYCWTMGVRRYFAAYVRRMLPHFVEPELDCIKLRLPFEVNSCKDRVFIEKLLGFAAAKKVKEIHLDFSDEETLYLFHQYHDRWTVESSPSVFNLTDSIYKVTSLRVLSLGCCGLRNFNFDQKFMELTSLSFAGMFVTREILINIGYNCPNLEELRIVDCYLAMNSMRFSSAWLKLKRLIIKRARPCLAGLELFAPKIQYLEISAFLRSFEVGDDLENLFEVVFDLENQTKYCYREIMLIDLLLGLKCAKILTLTHRFLEVLPGNDLKLHELPLHPENPARVGDMKFCELPLLLENLEHLRVRTNLEGPALCGVLCILRSSPNLKSISIDTEYIHANDKEKRYPPYCPYHRIMRAAYIPPRFQFYSLKEAKLEGFTGNNDQMNLLEFLLSNAAGLQKVFIFFPKAIPFQSDEIEPLIKWTMRELEKMERIVLSIRIEVVFQADIQVRLSLPALSTINNLF